MKYLGLAAKFILRVQFHVILNIISKVGEISVPGNDFAIVRISLYRALCFLFITRTPLYVEILKLQFLGQNRTTGQDFLQDINCARARI